MLITESYRALNAGLHRSNPRYGSFGHKWAERVRDLAAAEACADVLDVGCGKGTLVQALAPHMPARGYDPAMPEFSAEPEPADLVTCLDVLEHVEPECLDAVLAHLRALTRRVALLAVALIPSDKRLADGRNAHLLVRPGEWWAERIGRHFALTPIAPFKATLPPREFAALAR